MEPIRDSFEIHAVCHLFTHEVGDLKLTLTSTNQHRVVFAIRCQLKKKITSNSRNKSLIELNFVQSVEDHTSYSHVKF